MFSWWPRSLSTELILPLRSLGRKNLRMGPRSAAPVGRLIGGTTEDQRYVQTLLGRSIIWNGQQSLAEQRLNRISDPLRFVLARILADGPKLFVMPTGMEKSLNQMEIPLQVKEFFPPFPATIVQRENGDYHFVVQNEETLTLAVMLPGNQCDTATMFSEDRTIESYLNDDRRTEDRGNFKGLTVQAIIKDNQFAEHQFRATLNFLLLATMQGVLSKGYQAQPRLVSGNPILKRTNPELFIPQNLELFRRCSASATTPEPEHVGSAKRPHFRRAHWRRVAKGVGRTERELRLIRCCFVNRERLANPDSDLTYTAKPKPR